MASGRTAESPVQYVQLDGLVALKIIKHCQEEGQGTELVQGVLLGLVENNRLEVTNCFPFPRHTDDEDFDEVTYQMEMMRLMRDVNIDHLHVGWYQSANFGAFINKTLLDSQFNYQHSIEESIVLIYDPLRTSKGHLSIKALRLTPNMMQMYTEGDFSPESVSKSGLNFQSMFEEVPVVLKNSHLADSLLFELEDQMPETDKYSFLDMASGSVLEKKMSLLMECVDELVQDTNKFISYQRLAAKQELNKRQYLLKRKQDNEARQARGEPPLPEEDLSKQFKPLSAPPRLDSLLLAGQIARHAEQIAETASHSFGKLLVAEAMHTGGASSSSATDGTR